jgi:hypothetical protein
MEILPLRAGFIGQRTGVHRPMPSFSRPGGFHQGAHVGLIGPFSLHSIEENRYKLDRGRPFELGSALSLWGHAFLAFEGHDTLAGGTCAFEDTVRDRLGAAVAAYCRRLSRRQADESRASCRGRLRRPEFHSRRTWVGRPWRRYGLTRKPGTRELTSANESAVHTPSHSASPHTSPSIPMALRPPDRPPCGAVKEGRTPEARWWRGGMGGFLFLHHRYGCVFLSKTVSFCL